MNIIDVPAHLPSIPTWGDQRWRDRSGRGPRVRSRWATDSAMGGYRGVVRGHLRGISDGNRQRHLTPAGSTLGLAEPLNREREADPDDTRDGTRPAHDHHLRPEDRTLTATPPTPPS